MTDRPSVPSKIKRASNRFRWILVGFALIVLSVFFAPAIVARTGMRDRLINTMIAAPNLSASTDQASLGWFSPLSVNGFTIDGKQHRFRLEVESLTADRSWPQLLASSPDLGKISVEKPQVWLNFPLGETGSVAPILSPTFTAAITDAALSVHHENSQDPIIDVEGVDLTVHLRDSEQGRLLSVDSLDVYEREKLTREHCGQLLGLIKPSLDDATEMEGEFSLALSKLNVPIGVSEEQMMERLEVEGELALHEVAVETNSELLQTLAKLVADVHKKPVPAQTRVVKDALIQFQIRGGRVYHEYPLLCKKMVSRRYSRLPAKAMVLLACEVFADQLLPTALPGAHLLLGHWCNSTGEDSPTSKRPPLLPFVLTSSV